MGTITVPIIQYGPGHPPTGTQIGEVTRTTVPKVMSKTDFNKFGWSKLGMAAFQKILEDTRNSTGTTTADYEARAAVTQYDAALTVSKAEVEAIGVKIKAAGHMTQAQFDAMTGANWPEV